MNLTQQTLALASRLATEWLMLVDHSFTRASSLPEAISFVSTRLKSTDQHLGMGSNRVVWQD